MKRCIWLAARLYPAVWREHYGDEFDALLDDSKLRWRDLADVIRGAAAMQLTKWNSYWRITTAMGLAGALVALAVAFSIPNRWTSFAILTSADPIESPEMQRVMWEFLSPSAVSEFLHDPTLKLYQKEQQHLPLGEVAGIFKRHVEISALSAWDQGRGRAIRISFTDTDRINARAVATRLALQFQRQAAALAGTERMKVLDFPEMPERPTSPRRLLITLVGLLSGMLMGTVSLALWRRTHKVLSVSLPADVRPFVASQVAEGSYRDAGEYIRALIHAEEQRKSAPQA